MSWKAVALVTLATFATLVGCGAPAKTPLPDVAARATYESATYKDPAKWLCLPGRAGDACAVDLSATEIRADGSRVIEPAPAPPARTFPVDCFYIYPTVDLSPVAGNHDDFSDTRPMGNVAAAQAARFREVCNVYAPLYRQITFSTYLRPPAMRNAYEAVAESDVEDAFLHYLAQWNHGRKVVLIGHSQGASMVVRMLQRLFDHDEAMRAKLLYAMPIGFRLHVQKDKLTGGTFENLALCEREDEEGCVITYRSFVDEAQNGVVNFDMPPSGLDDACVSPSVLLGNDGARFSGAYFPLSPQIKASLGGSFEGIETPFVLLRDYYAGRCKYESSGRHVLAVVRGAEPGDVREDGLKLNSFRWKNALGLHVLDMQFAQGDLIEIIGRKTLSAQ